ncbi:hypothetical protein E2C01_064708 [Portunus trituberculatus]|uniref:Uncharacterized protein n=1 Tax=Portunus trituberculatus TaxID=210409 RepID=A0A5B7HL32_PORTR|nr:hypothetical protein [Portunus trituberculatus]
MRTGPRRKSKERGGFLSRALSLAASQPPTCIHQGDEAALHFPRGLQTETHAGTMSQVQRRVNFQR